MTETQFPNLLSPLRVGPRTLRNRVLVTAHVARIADHGVPGDRYVAYHRAKARGGVALQITGATPVHRSSDLASPDALDATDDRIIPGYRRLAAAVHAEGGCMLAQLAHYGAGIHGAEPGQPLWAPSPRASELVRETPHAMTTAEIDEMVAAFGAAARRVREGGMDGVEILGAFGMLIAAFMSPYSNKRTDAYGGSLENRLRYPLEVFKAMRAVWPEDKPMSVRISATDWVGEEGITGDDGLEIAKAFAAAGVDIIDVSSGQTSTAAEPVYGRMFQTPFSDKIRNEGGLATMAVGNIYEIDHVNSIIMAGRADLCILARPHLMDPFWTLRAAAEQEYHGVKVPVQYEAGFEQLERNLKRQAEMMVLKA